MNLIPFLAQQLGGGATAGIWHIFIIILEIAAIAFLVWLVAWWALDRIVAAFGAIPQPAQILITILRVIIVVVAAFWVVNLLLAAGGAHI